MSNYDELARSSAYVAGRDTARDVRREGVGWGPGDHLREWTFNHCSLTVAGAAFDQGPWIKQYGCSFHRLSDVQAVAGDNRGYTAPIELDLKAQEKAAGEGRPYFYALPSADGSDPFCHSAIRLPDGSVWFMNTPGSAPATGVSMQATRHDYACRKGL